MPSQIECYSLKGDSAKGLSDSEATEWFFGSGLGPAQGQQGLGRHSRYVKGNVLSELPVQTCVE